MPAATECPFIAIVHDDAASTSNQCVQYLQNFRFRLADPAVQVWTAWTLADGSDGLPAVPFDLRLTSGPVHKTSYAIAVELASNASTAVLHHCTTYAVSSDIRQCVHIGEPVLLGTENSGEEDPRAVLKGDPGLASLYAAAAAHRGTSSRGTTLPASSTRGGLASQMFKFKFALWSETHFEESCNVHMRLG